MEEIVLKWYLDNTPVVNTVILIFIVLIQLIPKILPEFLKHRKEMDEVEAINSKAMIEQLVSLIKTSVTVNSELISSVNKLSENMNIQGGLLREVVMDLSMVYAYLQLDYPPKFSRTFQEIKDERSERESKDR